jgi:hypothetical protein
MLTTHAPPPRLIPFFAIHHATQSQAARLTAKTFIRMFMGNGEKLVATRPNARLARKIFRLRRNALALARRRRVS